MKTLLTDLLFPSKYGLWRITEISSFIREKETDILVFKVDKFANITLEIDYEEMCEEFSLRDYNILIFDERYNYINKYNRRVDGTAWNGKFYGSYLFTKNVSFDLSSYEIIYHIFLNNYIKFNQNYSFPIEKQAIHLYPGGGFMGKDSLHSLNSNVKLVSTTPQTSEWLDEIKHTNYIECTCGPLTFSKGETPHLKQKNSKGLKVAFASMGHAIEKGAKQYVDIVNSYKDKFPLDDIEFVSIGINAISNNIKHIMPMAMKELSKYYRDDIDIIISIDTGLAFNGWPLGLEAVINGVALVTTDPYQGHIRYNVPDDSILVFDLMDIAQAVQYLRELYSNRERLRQLSSKGQAVFFEKCCYKSQQEKIFNYLYS